MKKYSLKSDTGKVTHAGCLSFCRPRGLPAIVLVILTQFCWAQSIFAQPGFSKTFEPDTIGHGSVSTLTFTIDNSAGAVPATELEFSDTLPAAVSIAGFANAQSTCGGALSAPAGGSTISLDGGSLAAFSSCSISVDVTSAGGSSMNVSGDLTSSQGNSGPASDELTVTGDRPGFSKGFAPSNVLFGERTTLTFLIESTSQLFANLSFTDMLPRGLFVASPSNALTNCFGGVVEANPGDRFITLLGGEVTANKICTVSVDVIARAVGELGNASGSLTSSPGGTSGGANAVLQVTAGTVALVKSFLDDPVPAGKTVTLEFTILNRSRTEGAANISFEDDLEATLSGLEAVGLPRNDVCGAGSSLTGVSPITLTGGYLGPEEQCSFSVDLQVPAAAASGVYINEVSEITADVGVVPYSGNPDKEYEARDSLFVSPVPSITKTFIGDPVGAGGIATLEFTITNNSGDLPATDISFTDTSDVILQSAASLPANGSCGAGSDFSFTLMPPGYELSALLVTGASLAAGDSCTFTIELDVSPTAPSGIYDNATSAVTATVDGETVVGPPASGQLEVVGGPKLRKSFVNNPVPSPGLATLEFTVSNDSNGQLDADVYDDFTDVAFDDDLSTVLSGLVAVGLPQNDICGTGSSLTGSAGGTLISFQGGSVPERSNCSFQLDLQVPPGVIPYKRRNTTGEATASARGLDVSGNAATDDMEVAGLVLTKMFTDDPVLPGGTVTLEFIIENNSVDQAATDIFFQDYLNNTLNGLTATGLPLNDICGISSSLSGGLGDTLVAFTGGSLAAGDSCTFSVTLQVPGGAAPGIYENETQQFRGTMNDSPASFANARDDLIISDSDVGPVRVTVNKSYTVPHPAGSDPEVFITLSCPGAIIAENGGVDVETVNGAATFTVSNLPFEGVVCNATETVPAGYVPVSSDCDAIEVVAGADPGPSCTITNRPTEAIFTVGKAFSDGNPVAGVAVTPACTNGGLITSANPANGIASENTDVDFTVRYFTSGAVCTATEAPITGYLQGVAIDDCTVDQPIADVGGKNFCEFYNTQDPAAVTVYKAYPVANPSGNPEVEITLTCPSASITSTNPVMTAGGVATFTVQGFPWAGEDCEATEVVPTGYMQIAVAGCDALTVLPGGAQPECTIYNTLIAPIPPIPASGRYGLALLALLMLGVGLVGFRRFA